MGNTNKFYNDVMALHKEVTGSCFLNIIKFPDGTTRKVLVDCGLFQEMNYSELNKSLPFNPSEIDYVLVTHNHIDHTGRLPLLTQMGYTGHFYMSHTTAKLIPNALDDSYKVLREKAKMANTSILYTDDSVDLTKQNIKGCDYEQSIWLDDNIKITFFKNGHLPGAATILMQIRYNDGLQRYENINLLYTGDYNNKNMFFDVPPIPKWVHQLPISIIQESTYGDMNSTDIEYVFEKNILDAISQGKEVVIPVFSLGRSQEIMYVLKQWQDCDKLDRKVPIYFDGKLGIYYTNLYLDDGLDNKEECMNFLPDNFEYVYSRTQREKIVADDVPKIILTTSGMGSHGPAQTYLPIYLKKSNALIHFTGYVAEGTLGRRLFEAKKEKPVEVAGLTVKKQCDVQFTSEFSAHAKADELIDFLRPFEDIKLILINHGNSEKKQIYAERVIDEINPKNVGIINRDYFFRIDGYGFIKSLTTKFV